MAFSLTKICRSNLRHKILLKSHYNFVNKQNLNHIVAVHTETHANRDSSYDSSSDSSSSDSSSSENNRFSPQLDRELKKLYNDHIPTSLTQKLFLTFGSAAASIIDPHRHDMIAVFGETSGHWALQKMHKQMLNDSEGREILNDEPRINSSTIDIDKLEQLPDGTFGKEYYNFLAVNKVSPDTRRTVQFVDDVQLAYVMQRYREVHDLVHTLLGMPTNMLGEVVVKWIEAIQTDLPMCWAGAVFGAMRLAPKQRRLYVDHHLQWALRCGHESKLLINIYYENRFQQNIDELRRELKIPHLPIIK